MADYGSGIHLTREFDFEVDESGDIRTTSGLSELQKDTSYFLSDNLREELGRRLDNSSVKKAKVVAEDVLLEDPRIESVIGISAREFEDNSDRIELVASVVADTGEQELVVEV